MEAGLHWHSYRKACRQDGADVRRLIFRRLMDDFKAQQWLAVGIDLLIVILGVFIGIEAANWNARRQDRQEERRYYEQIIGDLDSDLKDMAEARRFSAQNDNAADFVLASLADDANAVSRPGPFASSIIYAGYLYFPQPNRQTYDELISTGNLRLLRDGNLNRAIAQYYALVEMNRQWDSMIRMQQSEYWSQIAGLLPRPALRAVMRGVEPPLAAEEVKSIVAKARSRPNLTDQLTAMAAYQEWLRRDSERIGRQASKLHTRLRQHVSEMD